VSYYMGDYYRGGFFSSVFGGIKKVAGSLLGLGGGGGGQKALPVAGPANPIASVVGQVNKYVSAGKALASKHPVLSAAAAAGALAVAGKGASMARAGSVHPAVVAAMGGRRRRRMHVTNVRALRRALRRTHGFAKLAMKVIRLEHPRKAGKFGGFKKKKRARV
jgi:hypothetical protein